MTKTNEKARKRGNGEGSIFQLDDGSWMAQISLGYREDGKRNRPTFRGASRKDVADQIKEARRIEDERAAKAAQSAQALSTGNMPLKVALKDWLLTFKKISVSSRTFAWYMDMATPVITYLGDIPVAELTTPIVQKFINYAYDTLKRSRRTVSSYKMVLDQCMTYYSEQFNIRNPVDGTVMPRDKDKNRERVVDALTISDRQAFLKAIEGHTVMNPIMSTFLFTGMRTGEILGLPWDCVEFEKGIIRVYRQLQLLDGEYRFMSLKNDKTRVITPSRLVMDTLREQKRVQAAWRLRMGQDWIDGDFVFTNEIGEHMKRQTLYKAFKEVMEAIGLPHVRFHDMRHAYAVASIRAGDDVETVRANMGHHSAAFTLDVYGHVTEQMRRESAARMDRFIEENWKR